MFYKHTLTFLCLFCFLSPCAWAEEDEVILCAKNGNLSCIKRIVKEDKRAIFSQDKEGNSLLIIAAGRGSNAMISYIAQTWADWRTNNVGANALHAAAAANYTDTAQLITGLAKEDPDVDFERFINAKDTKNGATPLHWAAAHCNQNLYDFLVEQGAQKDTVDFAGRTPQQMFLRCKDKAGAKNTAAKKTAKTAAKPAAKAAPAPVQASSGTAHTKQIDLSEVPSF